MRCCTVVALIVVLAVSRGATGQAPAACETLEACRTQALEAAAAGDYERFHDLAWLAVRRGKPNDPELMFQLARAQSLSGRPGDALVMVRRLAAMGIAPDVENNDDFKRVRALPGWPEVAALIASARDGKSAVPVTPAPEPSRAVGTTSTPGSSTAGRPPAAPPAPADEAREPLTVARRSFAPVGLAYDSVSRRFIAGDRRANKLMVLDEEFRRVNDLAAAASAGFFGLTAVAIDRTRGDLWVANAREDGSETALHRLQLISGRVLQVLPLPTAHGAAAIADISLTPGGAVLALDTRGKRVFALRAGSYARPLDVANGDLLSIAALDEHVACVATREGLLRVDFESQAVTPVRAAGKLNLEGLVHIRAHQGAIVGVQPDGEQTRIVRVRLDAARSRAVAADTIAEVMIADPTSIAIDGGTVHYLARDADGTTTVRHVPLIRR